MNPKAELIDFTGKGRHDETWHAANILIFTKRTRLALTPDAFREVKSMPLKEKQAELDYMASTIPSSWEMCDLTFLISNVTRACAQQMTRTRTASYAMQSQRVVDMEGAVVSNPYDHEEKLWQEFDDASRDAVDSYIHLTENGGTREEARGLLPMNTQCNLVAKYNLRSLVELVRARESLRTQSEYGEIVRQMKKEVLAVWPWADRFFKPKHETAIRLLEEAVEEVGLETGSGLGWKLAKIADLIR
jgi:flavin-dependent thymidylate synthase